jgi:hypothetical protein
MPFYNSETLEQALKNQIRRLKQKTEILENLSSRLSAIRFFDFLLVAVLVFLAAKTGILWIFWVTLLAGIGSFAVLVRRHQNIESGIDRFKNFRAIRKQHLARLRLDWDDIPEYLQRASKQNDKHPFARDFNITGSHSLIQLLNTAVYPGGRERLEKWLLKKEPDLEDIERRQLLIKELKPMAHFRDRLHLYANLAQTKRTDHDWSMDELLQYLQSAERKKFGLPLFILGSVAGLNIVLLVLYLGGILGPYVIFTFLAYLLAYNFYSGKVAGLFNEAGQINNLLSQFREVLLYLESYPYKKDSALSEFCSVYHSGNQKPSGYLKKIIRIASAASSQGSELTWFVLNSLVPWDMYFAQKLDAYKHELEPKLRKWLHRFYRLEASNAIANFAWLNPSYTFSLPKKKQQSPVFEATDLGHPLIPDNQKITNDVAIDNVGDIQLITGSNMAGKSTYLRTIGINLALCHAGAPVNASFFETAPFRLFSSINVTDSLDEGLSHFYAEVKRLRALLDQLKQPHEHPLFFMVDEIYRGTNNRERLAGSEAFLKNVAGKDGVGLVSTHDLELARLEEEIPTLSNWHFEETIEDGKMRFEYKLKPGPCPSTNALKIMEMEGLPT